MPVILHLIPTLAGGGAERQLALLAAEQVRRGYDVVIASWAGGVHEARVRDAGVRLIRLRRGHRHPGSLPELLALLHRFRPAVVHTWLTSMDLLGGVAARLTRTPWILCERSIGAPYPNPLKDWLRCRLARHAASVIANSRQGGEYWEKRLPPGHCSVAPNALDLAAIDAADPTLPADAPWDLSRPLVLFAGRFEEEKNLPTTLRAFEAVAAATPARFALCGEGPLLPAVRAEVAAGPLAAHAWLPGYRTDVLSLLRSASVFVNLSRFEGMPNTVMEAAAIGCPMVVSDIPAHRELLGDGAALFVPADDAPAAAAAIGSVLERPQEARARADVAGAIVRRFTAARMADGYDAVYRRLLPRTAAGPVIESAVTRG